MEVSKRRKAIFGRIHEVVGMVPKVVTYNDADNRSEVDIYIGVDRPDFGITTYATIGLSEHPIDMAAADGSEIRVEMIALCESSVAEFPNILSTCAFNIINDRCSCRPGTVYPGVVSMYREDVQMEHVLFSDPYLWDGLGSMRFGDELVTWLMAVPISQREFEYLLENGSDALEDLLEEHSVDVFDLHRRSVLG